MTSKKYFCLASPPTPPGSTAWYSLGFIILCVAALRSQGLYSVCCGCAWHTQKESRAGKIVFIHIPLPREQVPHLVADKLLQQPALQGYQVPDSWCTEAFAGDPEGHRVSHMTRSWSGGTRVLQSHILARVRQGRGLASISIPRYLCEARAVWDRGGFGGMLAGEGGQADWGGRNPWPRVAGS